MEGSQNGVECGSTDQFWPISHPIEPPDEDRPVKCPSVINEEKSPIGLRKRAELSAETNKVAAPVDPPRAVRKRHHALTCGDHILSPRSRMHPRHPFPVQDIAIFEMFQQFNNFES